ncbi:hypothetical protein SAMN02745163_04418 [Clostridium cavendishii DSM 21758]|uniref:YacP-like NYN domain-containing protein n=1 Tax=Clostridium cavendishii DSM 21758 TaxID=1121302 RepID=A0A1M6V3J6_9CLOT|nr:NYN domain-containing protein [Clostridium cavendishii]SHK76033.1 hypothetical protein SAMN02745163_04418 [Clostridium cavendishii DSM 21758]
MKSIFVDGYNVINSWPNLNKVKEYSYASARKELIDILQNYGAYNNCNIILVFDAHKVGGNMTKREAIGSVVVVFTKDGETADSYIERCVNNIGKKIEVVVVTSDSLEQQTVFQRGAVRMSCFEFYNEVLKTKDKIQKKVEKNKRIQKDWLEDRLDKSVLEKLEKMRRGN